MATDDNAADARATPRDVGMIQTTGPSGSGGRRRDRGPPPCPIRDSTWPARYPVFPRPGIPVSRPRGRARPHLA
ncbi:hypothetical protein DVZ84_23825 [Streptomyces parvulus]|uniref:Uncharacterized protein n=1 Tax=Streptomyces parvulus TaxID=146923 RepID=A0A369V3Q3_9ACTN|nr:hypothetical protein DVZ84_23825 [Streptomyces parvulus]